MNRLVKILIPVIAATAAIIVSSCSDSKRASHTQVITDWVGCELILPDELVYQIQADTIDLDLDRPDYKIVSYIDSTGCTSCRMKLTFWSELIDELKSLPDVDVEVIMIVNAVDQKEITYLLQRDNYLNPVAIDPDNFFDRLNELPPKSEHHTFLLDAENKVVAIGNPVLNPKIKIIYLQCLIDGAEPLYANELCKSSVLALGVVNPGDTVKKVFYLENTGSDDLNLQAIVPSCDCVTASADFTTLSAGDIDKKVTVTYIADSVTGYFNRYVDIFFIEKELPERLSVYGYNNNYTRLYTFVYQQFCIITNFDYK